MVHPEMYLAHCPNTEAKIAFRKIIWHHLLKCSNTQCFGSAFSLLGIHLTEIFTHGVKKINV